jgi:hypothetical protein
MQNTVERYLFARLDLEGDAMQYVREFGLRCLVSWVTFGRGLWRHTAYLMTKSSHWTCPAEGHEGSGLGSMNSGGSRSSSENSLTRSIATIDCSKPTNLRTRKSSFGVSASSACRRWRGAYIVRDCRCESKSEASEGSIDVR